MEANYVIVYEINAQQTLFVPESVFNVKFVVSFDDNKCYYNVTNDLEYSQFSHEYRDLHKGPLNIKVVGHYDWEVEY